MHLRVAKGYCHFPWEFFYAFLLVFVVDDEVIMVLTIFFSNGFEPRMTK